MTTATLVQKIWDSHVIPTGEGRPPLLYIDLHLVHEVTSPQAFEGLRLAGRRVRRPDQTLATVDHNVPTVDRNRPWSDPLARAQVDALRHNCRDFGVPLLGLEDVRQGIVHVVGPEQGATLPGTTIVCGDSHTATHGAFGALAFGIGTSEVEHVLATQTLVASPPRTMAIELDGRLAAGVSAKDVILAVIARIGVSGGVGYVLEYRGPLIDHLDMEGRMTICNMSIEAGARAGLCGPDDVTFAYLEGRPLVPKGKDFQSAVAAWRALATDPSANFDAVHRFDANDLAPRVSWGTTPAHNVSIEDRVPDPADLPDPAERLQAERALAYMGLRPKTPIADIPIDRVFIGSCTNGRIEDLRAAARVLEGRRVAQGVRAMVVPGSGLVKAAAEREGLDRIFLEAGFEWRDPGCSMCLGMNPDVLARNERCASTSNRNFEGRQGPGGRTHLVSPATAAASAVAGHFADPRAFCA